LGNKSSGHQGFAIAEAARERGATVSVIAANVTLPLGEGLARVDVVTGIEFASAVKEQAPSHDVVIMAAAVADYRPRSVSDTKIKKSGDSVALELVETEDLLATLVASKRRGQVLVGFAAETGDATHDYLEHGSAKARRKGADLLAVNRVGEGVGFGDVDNEVHLLDSRGQKVGHAAGSKGLVAHAILDAVSRIRLS
jgi:phosphopantothenoylcysteine decarboxylase/phosphopantothenate--cysteine ligase